VHSYFVTMNYIETDALVDEFLNLAVIEGTSLKEDKVAAYLRRRLDPLRIRIVELPATGANGTAANMLCIPEETDPAQPLIVLAAHMDTVRSTAGLKPVLRDGKITSDGTTILGADNRAGVTALLYMLLSVRQHNLKLRNIALLFTVAEEIGMIGARNLDLSQLHSVKYIFVFDCSRPPGIFIQHCFGCGKFHVTVYGKPAHAGVAPEQGVNAIAIAAGIIHEMKQGRFDDEATFNIGVIHGGEATNVVSSEVRFDGEIRGPSMDIIEYHLTQLRKTASEIAARFKGKIELRTTLDFAPYHIESSSEHFGTAEAIIRQANLNPQPIRYSGGSDANAFNERGIPAVNFGIGAQQPHSNEEFIYIDDLIKTTEIVFHAAVDF
jgi:tripeptide aminopeptidase